MRLCTQSRVLIKMLVTKQRRVAWIQSKVGTDYFICLDSQWSSVTQADVLYGSYKQHERLNNILPVLESVSWMVKIRNTALTRRQAFIQIRAVVQRVRDLQSRVLAHSHQTSQRLGGLGPTFALTIVVFIFRGFVVFVCVFSSTCRFYIYWVTYALCDKEVLSRTRLVY